MMTKKITLNNKIIKKRKQVEEFEKKLKTKLKTHFEERNEVRIKKMKEVFKVIKAIDEVISQSTNEDQNKQGNKYSVKAKKRITHEYMKLKEKYCRTFEMLSKSSKNSR